MLTVICLAGKAGSGKTTVSKKFCTDNDFTYISTGDFLRQIAADRGLISNDRYILQQLSEEFINHGWVSFCRNVFSFFGFKYNKNILIDGVRNVECLHALRNIFHEDKMFLIYLDISDFLSIERQKKREIGRASCRERV